MNNEPNFIEALHWLLTLGPDEAVKRLKGVQGPERHLVGDVAERIPQEGGVEEVKPGRRGVGEIGGASELLRHIERKISEARGEADAALYYNNVKKFSHAEGKEAALVELHQWLSDTAEKRSDLSNS